MLTSSCAADGLVAPGTSQTTTLPYANRLLKLPDAGNQRSTMMSDSESDLSDAPEPQLPAAVEEGLPPHTSHENGVALEESGLSDGNDGDIGSDDADFDIDSQPLEATNEPDEHSLSEGSSRPPKRKAHGIEDDEDIKNNPELYGIRRSVWIHCQPHCQILTSIQGRARNNAPIVCQSLSLSSCDTKLFMIDRKSVRGI